MYRQYRIMIKASSRTAMKSNPVASAA
jgi:hypothetical protein